MGVGAVVLAGCGGVATVDETESQDAEFYADATSASKAQAAELGKLGKVDEVAFRPVTHDLSWLRGPALLDGHGDPGQAVRAMAAANPALFSGAALRVDAVRPLSDGTVVLASQLAAGRRVLGGGYAFVFDIDSHLRQVAGGARTVLTLPPPRLDPQGAERAARALLASELPGIVPLLHALPEPVVIDGHGAYRVLLDAQTSKGPTRRAVLVDDQTGEIRGNQEELRFVKAHGTGALGDKRTFEATDLGHGKLGMIDGLRGNGIETYADNGGNLPGDLVSAGKRESWDRAATGAGAAVDAHANAEVVFDFYNEVFGRSSLDGNSGTIVSTVHYGQDPNNAFWDGAQMVYGDGDGVTFAPLAAGLDVVAHELTHGVTQFSCALGGAGQPGALNEALSDTFASFLQQGYGTPSQAWQIGSTVYEPGTPGAALRDLSDPQRLSQPDHMSLYQDDPQDAAHDNGQVHLNSTIAGHAFFLMSEGGTDKTSGMVVSGLGYEKVEQIAYHALTHGLTPDTDFAQCARATIASASSLYDDAAAETVRAAWEAVGVLTPATPGGGGTSTDGGAGDVEPNNTRKTASPVSLGQTISGAIDDGHDVDFFRFELGGPANVTIRLSGLTADLDMKLYNAKGRVIARSELPDTQDEVIHGHFRKKGKYYVRVAPAVGTTAPGATYQLTVQ
jgi:Zn-dependent metalloprotease